MPTAVKKSYRSSTTAVKKEVVKKAEVAKKAPRMLSRKCTDSSGHTYDSMLEMNVTGEFQALADRGYLSNLQKQVTFPFDKVIKGFTRTYTADLTFDCDKTFEMDCLTPIKNKLEPMVYIFSAGHSYVIDIKSPKTYRMSLWRFKKKLMEVTYGVSVVEFIRKHPPKPRKKKA